MKRLAIALVATLVAVTAPAAAQQRETPDAEHQLLASLAGKWTVTQSYWAVPGKPPKIDHGSAELAMILAGRHLRQTVRIDDGTSFEGLGYFGYDGATKRFFSTWMDVNFPGIVIARGALDTGARSITLTGTMDQADKSVPVREVLLLLDGDHFRYEFYETHDGHEALAVRLDYARSR
jgi:hypothetical protein